MKKIPISILGLFQIFLKLSIIRFCKKYLFPLVTTSCYVVKSTLVFDPKGSRIIKLTNIGGNIDINNMKIIP